MRIIENFSSETQVTIQADGWESLTDLTCAAIEATTSPWRVVDTIEPRIQTLEAASQHHFALYAMETLVSALARCNLKQEARSKFLESRQKREQLGITYSAWDARRLHPFVVAS